MACPSEVELLDFLQARDAHAAIPLHVAECDSCEQLVDALDELSKSRANGSVPAPATTAVLPVPGDELGRYRVESQLGRGAMGVVYAARDPKLDRKVALKLLLQSQRSAIDEARVLLEARAAARVHDPHLISVYDVGTWNGRVFIAMEYVDGPTLTRWLVDERDRRDILRVLIEVTRGLVAAHRAGLVHCDIKPDNILIGPTGAKLGDFGLAVGPEESTTGARGTPLYMAPEVLHDGTPTTSSDQFSLCVTMLEALTGRRPVRRAGTDGTLFDTTQLASLPRWLAKAITRGLSLRPTDRFPSVLALLAALDRRRWQKGVVAATVFATAFAATGITFAAARPAAVEPCPLPRAELASTWSPDRAALVASMFGAESALVTKRIDAYAASWLETSAGACRDTRVAHRYSDDVLDLRSTCLDQVRSRLDAGIDQMLSRSAGRAASADDALRMLDNLPSLEACNDVTALVKNVPPLAPIKRSQVRAWSSTLDIAWAMIDLRRSADALRQTRAIAPGIAALSDVPTGRRLEANRLYLEGLALADLDRRQEAVDAYERAYAAARSVADEDLEVKVALEMTGLLAKEPATRGDAKAWLGRARAVAERLHDKMLDTGVSVRTAALAYAAADYPTAISSFTSAIALYAKTYGDDHMKTALTRSNLALVLNKVGKHDDARDEIRRAITGLTNARGDSHPSLILFHNTLGIIEQATGNVQGARAAYSEARRRAIAAKGETDRSVIMLDINLAGLALRDDDLVAARTSYEHALAAIEQTGGRGDKLWRGARQGLAQTLIKEGDDAAAQAILEELLAQRLADKVPDPPAISSLRIDLAEALSAQHHEAEALAQLDLARAGYASVLGERHDKVAYVDIRRAGLLETSPARAEKILAPIIARDDLTPAMRAQARYYLARALVAKDAARARALGADAAAIAREGGDTVFADQITTWMKTWR